MFSQVLRRHGTLSATGGGQTGRGHRTDGAREPGLPPGTPPGTGARWCQGVYPLVIQQFAIENGHL